MKRPFLPLLLFLCALIALVFAREASVDDLQQQQPLQERPIPSDAAEWTAAKTNQEDGAYGEREEDTQSSAVIEASAILWKIKPPKTSQLASFVRKPKGVLGTVAYYAKEAFLLLFMNGPKQSDLLTTSTTTQPTKLAPTLSRAVKILDDAARENDPAAILLLADINFYGNYSHPIDYDAAFTRYKQLADLNGNSTAQYMLGFLYATGLAPSVPSDQAKSMLYHTFAAEGGNTRSQMTLAYRHLAGIATPRNCDESVSWYKLVADKAIQYYRSGPPGGHSLVRDAYRIADEAGGVYGEGASVVSAGHNARQGGPTSDAYANVEDVLEYLHLQSSRGDLKATFGLARLHYDGARGLRRDLKLAKGYFMDLAREYWSANGRVKKDVPQGTERLAAKAAGYLGRMFLRGEGMEQSFSKAKIWFQRGISNGDALSQYSMGLMHLHGLGLPEDAVKAAEYFAAAADQDLAVAQTQLGKLFLDQGDAAIATKYFELAVRNSHIEAFYYLAEMNHKAIGRDRSCGNAAVYYKIVVEKAEAIWSSLGEAADAYEEGENSRALIDYLMAAEQGSENAQANVGWLLDQTEPRWSPLTWLASAKKDATNAINNAALALIHWTRSAKQNNIDSLVKMGDYYLAGLGARASAEHAAACYQAAAETLQSAQAMFNLGWMHENGIGIEQDFHLAKRFYDQALETNREAYLPVKLSLFKLRWRSWWNGVTRGGVHGIEEEQEVRKRRSFAEWLNDFLEADAAYYNENFEADDWDPNDPIPGGDEYWEGGEEYDDGVLETLLIGGLVAALGYLIYYRQQQQRAAEQRRRQALEGQQQGQGGGEQQPPPPAPGQQPDGGLFPPAGDPAWNDWVAGGVGH
ncbi:Sel1-like repeat-containing [Lecanosticta acicola]|uniref:Sel1-like repeat-containing n=1 Tax=Lecanosticta acicola TaxID=111012 RepID=A0AAI8W1X9_9PEZI|nr:Sel1-like repeat-containing [Lecanosticta acicola]